MGEGEMGGFWERGGEEPDFWGSFGRPGMMDRIGLGNLIPSFDAKERNKRKNTKNCISNMKMKNTREKHENNYNYIFYKS